jgi:hypothetical protein
MTARPRIGKPAAMLARVQKLVDDNSLEQLLKLRYVPTGLTPEQRQELTAAVQWKQRAKQVAELKALTAAGKISKADQAITENYERILDEDLRARMHSDEVEAEWTREEYRETARRRRHEQDDLAGSDAFHYSDVGPQEDF